MNEIDLNDKLPEPPEELSEAARELWRQVMAEYQIDDPVNLSYLLTALQAYDRINDAQKMYKRSGLLIKDHRGMYKKNPLLEIIRDNTRLFYDGMRMLHIDLEPLHDGVGRPGKANLLDLNI